MPVSEYEQTVQRVNVGYDLVFTLTHAFLRALGRPNLGLLVVGVGGGPVAAGDRRRCASEGGERDGPSPARSR